MRDPSSRLAPLAPRQGLQAALEHTPCRRAAAKARSRKARPPVELVLGVHDVGVDSGDLGQIEGPVQPADAHQLLEGREESLAIDQPQVEAERVQHLRLAAVELGTGHAVIAAAHRIDEEDREHTGELVQYVVDGVDPRRAARARDARVEHLEPLGAPTLLVRGTRAFR